MAFALGMMLLLAGIFTALYGTGWPYILMGLTLVVGVVLIKVMFEQGAKKDLERCGQALEKLDATLEETRQTR
ncbi:MAG: hypothetical protein GTO03_14450, partial [Planctomycetales bacterium]|nr:hypothetical protein [Planctomycetales bacterium]